MLRKKKRGVERENNKERDSDGGVQSKRKIYVEINKHKIVVQ